MTTLHKLGWAGVAILCAIAFGHVVGFLNPHEKVNGLWLVVAASCFYVIAYRFYGRFLARRVMEFGQPSTNSRLSIRRWDKFLSRQQIYSLWPSFCGHCRCRTVARSCVSVAIWLSSRILVDRHWSGTRRGRAGFYYPVASMRRNGRSLPEIAHAELGPITGLATAVAVLFIVVVALAGLGLAVVNALYDNAWGTFTIVMTIPIAFVMGLYLQKFRPGQVGEMTIIGLVLLVIAIIFGRTVAQSDWAEWFMWDRTTLTWCLATYGFLASVLPVWILLVPRDYLSTYMKLGVIALLGVGVIVLAPTIEMPRTTEFISGNGPIIPGTLFPFLFITIACGAISGFHSLVSSGTTPKLISQESQAIVGYGAMLLESFVGVIALIAACLLVPGDYFAINTHLPIETLENMGFPTKHIEQLSNMVEVDVSGRPGGAVSLAVGMASIFSGLPGMSGLMAYWYQFALLFEALFILTTIDAGTRVARYLVQELGGRVYAPLKQINWWPGVLGTSLFVVGVWGYLIGTGSIATIWPMFGAANQLLGMLALCIATTVLIKMNKVSYLWVTVIPMVFVGVITLAGCYELFNIFFNRAISDDSSQTLTMGLNATLVGLVALLAMIVLVDSARKW